MKVSKFPCNIFLLIIITLFSCNKNLKKNSIDSKVSSLLSKMTLEEKVGQMTQINISVITKGKDKFGAYEPVEIDIDAIEKAIIKYKVGSVLNAPNNRARSPKFWNNIIGEIQEVAKKTRLSIPIIYGIDNIHGTTYIAGGTMFPQQITTAATWNPKNAYEMAKITAYETRAASIPWNFSPVLDLGQDPRFPRQFETFGEDPYLAKVMGVEMIKGYQGINNEIDSQFSVAACIKHFLGYQTTISGKA